MNEKFLNFTTAKRFRSFLSYLIGKQNTYLFNWILTYEVTYRYIQECEFFNEIEQIIFIRGRYLCKAIVKKNIIY